MVGASGDAGAGDVRLDGSAYYLHPVTALPADDPLASGGGKPSFLTISMSAAGTVQGYHARVGYDLVTGVGTVDGKYFVPELAAPGKYW